MYDIEKIKNTIIQGDTLNILKEFPDESVDMIITSPPYWNLRDYGEDKQLGLEYTTKEYIDSLYTIFDESKRVLNNEGTLWINIRDTYSKGIKRSGVKNKSLSMIPERLAIKMIDNGWILRNTIIWHKPNAMPDSCKNRFTMDYEYLYMFSKQEKYYFKTQYEPYTSVHGKDSNTISKKEKELLDTKMVRHGGEGSTLNKPSMWNPKGRIKRTTWDINTKPFKGSHFAPYPEELIECPIDAGCPENGIVLDIFMGSGTTGVVTKKQNKNYIGIELNRDYIDIANNRINKITK